MEPSTIHKKLNILEMSYSIGILFLLNPLKAAGNIYNVSVEFSYYLQKLSFYSERDDLKLGIQPIKSDKCTSLFWLLVLSLIKDSHFVEKLFNDPFSNYQCVIIADH